MITTPIFTRIMPTTDFGQYGVFKSWFGIISIVIALSLTGGIHTQGLVKFESAKSEYSSSLQGLTLTLVLAWFAVYLALRNTWNSLLSLTTVQMVAMFIVVWTGAVFGFWANEQRAVYAYRNLVLVTLIFSIVKPVLELVLMQHSTDKATARILGWVIVDLLAFGWMFVSQMRRGRVFYSSRFWPYALKYSIPLIPHYLSQTVLLGADRIMIQKMIGLGQSGIYYLVYSISMIMTLFNSALMQTISPWMYQKIKERKGKDIAPVAYSTLILIAALNLALILLAPEAVVLFAPKAYYDAIWIIPPVAMSVFFMYTYDLFAKFAFYYERTMSIMVASIIGALLNVGLNYVFIHRFGYIAAGYTTLVCYAIYSIAHYLIMRKVCRQFCNGNYPYETKKIVLISVLFVAAGFILLVTYNHPAIRYGIVISAAVCIIVLRNRIADVVKKLIRFRKNEIG